MPRARGSVKRRSSKLRKGWPSKTRSYSWRKGSARPAETLRGIRSGVAPASTVHRFTRWGPKMSIVNYDMGGGVTGMQVGSDDNTVTIPLSIGTPTADTTANATQYKLGGSMQWTIADVPSSSEFTTLFDRYEIEQVDVEVNCTQNSATVGIVNSMPTITYVPDFDDATVPANPSTISQYQRAKTWTFRGDGKPLKFSVKPRVQVPVYRTGVTFAYQAGGPHTLVDLGNTDVPHYGLKFFLENLLSGTSPIQGETNITFKCKYHFKFLDPR